MNISINSQLGQFYTAQPFGRLLVASISAHSPDTVLDLGVGRGSLSSAALSRWSGATLISVDIDNHNFSCIRDRYPRHIHICSDAMADDLAEPLRRFYGAIDVAICNPPYIRTSWKKSFGAILEEAGLSGVIPKMRNTAADLIFLAQNLRMLRVGGELGIIVPAGVINSQRYRLLRKTLLERYAIKNVIQLPRGIFPGTDVSAFILTLAKNEPTSDFVSLFRTNDKGILSFPIEVELNAAMGRMDYAFHAWQIEKEPQLTTGVTLAEVSEIKRGSLDNVSARKYGIPIFHTTNFKDITNSNNFVIPDQFQAPKEILKDYLVAETGDIILARIGRSLEKQLAYIKKGKVILTDCVYRIRVSPPMRQAVWTALASADGRSWMLAHAKGTGARVLAKKDLQDFPIEQRGA